MGFMMNCDWELHVVDDAGQQESVILQPAVH